jgi:taurine dioxygenase
VTPKLDVRPLTPTIGAEIRGVDCADVDDDTIAAIRAAWLEWLVVFFPDQSLDDEQQIAFAERFGAVIEGHPIEPTSDAHPEVQPIDRLVAIHHDASYAARVANGESNLWDGARLERLDPVEHPVVRVHPETGRRALFVNPGFTRGVRGIPGAQGCRPAAPALQAHDATRFVVRYRWQPGTIAFWDNRATMHFGISDYGDDRRVMHRVILRGDTPIGPDA